MLNRTTRFGNKTFSVSLKPRFRGRRSRTKNIIKNFVQKPVRRQGRMGIFVNNHRTQTIYIRANSLQFLLHFLEIGGTQKMEYTDKAKHTHVDVFNTGNPILVLIIQRIFDITFSAEAGEIFHICCCFSFSVFLFVFVLVAPKQFIPRQKCKRVHIFASYF